MKLSKEIKAKDWASDNFGLEGTGSRYGAYSRRNEHMPVDVQAGETMDERGRFTDPQARLDIDQGRKTKDGEALMPEYGYREEEDGHAAGSKRL